MVDLQLTAVTFSASVALPADSAYADDGLLPLTVATNGSVCDADPTRLSKYFDGTAKLRFCPFLKDATAIPITSELRFTKLRSVTHNS